MVKEQTGKAILPTPAAPVDDGWITNASKHTAAEIRAHLSCAYRIGPPKATLKYSAEDLKKLDMVGIYEVRS